MGWYGALLVIIADADYYEKTILSTATIREDVVKEGEGWDDTLFMSQGSTFYNIAPNTS